MQKREREYPLLSFTAIFFSSPVWLPHYGVPPPSFRRQIRFAAAVRSNSRLNFDGVSAWQAENIVTSSSICSFHQQLLAVYFVDQPFPYTSMYYYSINTRFSIIISRTTRCISKHFRNTLIRTIRSGKSLILIFPIFNDKKNLKI